MSQDPQSNLLIKLFKELKNTIFFILDKIKNGEWIDLLIIIEAAFIMLLFPKTELTPNGGFIYNLISKYLPESYPIIYLLIVASVFILIIILVLLREYNNFSINKFWLFFVIAFVTIFIFHNLLPITKAREKYHLNDGFSWGEEFLIQAKEGCKYSELDATENYQKNNYKLAESSYSRYTKLCKNDPQVQIFLNNSIAMQSSNRLRIAVVVPIDRIDGIEDSSEILRGVAIAQKEWNSKPKNRKFLVLIADYGHGSEKGDCESDGNSGECKKARQVATTLSQEDRILGIIGPFSSGATQASAKIYQDAELVAISPTSTAVRSNQDSCQSEKFICLNPYIFRTAPNDSILIRKLIKKIPPEIKKIAIVYEGKSPYSRLFKLTFTNAFSSDQAPDSIINLQNDQSNVCNFSRQRGFNVEECLNIAKGQEYEDNALLLVPSAKNAQDIQKVLEKNQDEQYRLFILGSDSMYKHSFIAKTEGMLIAVPWHRRDDIPCEDNSERLECKAASDFDDSPLKPDFSGLPIRNPLKINWRTATAYDAAKALMNGLQQASEKDCRFRGDKCLRRKLKDILLTSKVEGFLGSEEIKFNQYGDRANDDEKLGVVVEVNNGNFIHKQ